MPGKKGFILVEEPEKYHLPPGLRGKKNETSIYGVTWTHEYHCLVRLRYSSASNIIKPKDKLWLRPPETHPHRILETHPWNQRTSWWRKPRGPCCQITTSCSSLLRLSATNDKISWRHDNRVGCNEARRARQPKPYRWLRHPTSVYELCKFQSPRIFIKKKRRWVSHWWDCRMLCMST